MIERKDKGLGRPIIFLDFDGVLHPEFSHPSKYFSCLPHFEAVVRRVPECEIVIASTWRQAHPLSELLKPFASDIAERIVGVTPVAQELVEIPDSLLAYEREAECHAWMRANERGYLPWIAIDDRAWLYRPFSRNVFLLDGSKGMQATDIEPMVLRLLECIK